MKYLEMILNSRIEELEKKYRETSEKLKEDILEGKFDLIDTWECNFRWDYEDLTTRIDELNKLKKDLGLVEVIK